MITKLSKSCTFTFVCQQGNLEIESILLATTLREHLPLCTKIIAGIPLPEKSMGVVSSATIDLLQSLDIEIHYFNNEFVLYNNPPPNDLLTNKIFLLSSINTNTDKVIFLDTDIVCSGPIQDWTWLSVQLAVARLSVEEMKSIFPSCNKIYDLIGCTPGCRIECYRSNEDFIYALPDANTSIIAVDTDLLPKITSCWFDTFKKVKESRVLSRPYFNEQASFIPSIHLLKIPFTYIPFGIGWHHYINVEKLQMNKDALSVVLPILKQHELLIRNINIKQWNTLLDSSS